MFMSGLNPVQKSQKIKLGLEKRIRLLLLAFKPNSGLVKLNIKKHNRKKMTFQYYLGLKKQAKNYLVYVTTFS